MNEQPDRSGSSIGPYELIRLIGRGGMGEVYEATDTRLGRAIALKILRPEVVQDAERKARFEREAKALAALNHPGIVTIHSFETIDDTTLITMKLIEGSPLTEILRKERNMPVDRVLEIAIPITDAIGAAHKQGITHRDIKPDNIIIGPKGQVTVLDFGLAKLAEPVISGLDDASATASMPGTVEGRIFGTVHYMSPEQAQGHPTDSTTDIFSLGIVIYEMATGQQPFSGESSLSMLSSILKDQPSPMVEIGRDVPTELDRIVSRCLEKDPDLRWQTGLDLRNELLGLKQANPMDSTPSDQATRTRNSFTTSAVLITCGIIAGGLIAFGLTQLAGSNLPTPEPISQTTEHSRLPVSADPINWRYTRQTESGDAENAPCLSPDESSIIYSAKDPETRKERIYLRRTNGSRSIPLTEDLPGEHFGPRYSPDGEQIIFHVVNNEETSIHIMGATGENPRKLDIKGHFPNWSPDGRNIAYSTMGYNNPTAMHGLGNLVVTDLDSMESKILFSDGYNPRWSEHDWIVFWTLSTVTEEYPEGRMTGKRNIAVCRPDGSQMTFITDDPEFDWTPDWSADGRSIVFASDRGGTMGIWKVNFDPELGVVTSAPELLPSATNFVGALDVGDQTDSIVYVTGQVGTTIRTVPLDPETLKPDGVPTVILGRDMINNNFNVSPDGRSLAFGGGPILREDIYVVNIDGGGLRRLTNDLANDRGASWDFDSNTIYFYSNRSGQYQYWSINTDGSNLRQISNTSNATQPCAVDTEGTAWMISGFGKNPTQGETIGYTRNQSSDTPQEELKQLPKIPDFNGFFVPGNWSHCGNRLTGFIGTDQTFMQREIGIFDLKNQTYERIMSPGTVVWANDIDWTPDDRLTVQIIGDDNGLYILDEDSGTFELLVGPDDLGSTEAGNYKIGPDWKLYYRDFADERNIWMAHQDKAGEIQE